MAGGRMDAVVRRLRQAVLLDGGGLSDGELLERYLSRREDAAFAALVRRLGPLVMGVCRRFLRDAHDADDAFQATFLVLVRKAHAITPRERVAAWLYGVAYRTSLKAKTMSSRRRAKQRALQDVPCPPPPPEAEWLALLDEEINRLPEKYRAAIVLCDLEGKTRKQAARQLGWPEGTLATRLQHARALVHKRLARHGLTLSAGAVTLTWTQALSAAVSPALVSATVQNAALLAAGNAAGAISLRIVALAEGVLKAMVLSKIKTVSAVVLLVGVLGLWLGGWVGRSSPIASAQARDDKVPAANPGTAPRTDQPFSAFDFTTPPYGNVDKSRRLPTGLPPVQALVRLEGETVVVTTRQSIFVPKTIEDTNVTRYETTFRLSGERHNRKDVEVRDTHNRRLDARDLPKLLKQEVVALVWAGPGELDPLHLRLTKEGTLVFIIAQRTVPAIPAGAPSTASALAFPPPPAPAPLVAAKSSFEQTAREQAERDLAIAKFYENTGHPESAAFYYELVRRRYAGSTFSEKANQRLQELPRRAIRIAQIIIVGNNYTPDAMIREAVGFYPGQVFNVKDLRAAEERLARLKTSVGFRASVQLLDPESKREYQDVVIQVRETVPDALDAELKMLRGSWLVISASLQGTDMANLKGAELVFSDNEVTATTKQHASKSVFLLNLSPTAKEMRLFPADGPTNARPTAGTYELSGDTLKLRLRVDGGAGSGTAADRLMELTLRRKDAQ